MKRSNLVLIAAGVAALFPASVLGADPATVDWKSVPTQTLTLILAGAVELRVAA